LNLEVVQIGVEDLKNDYPHSTIKSYTYQTDHGRHGPYKLEGVSLVDLIDQHLGSESHWTQVEDI